VRLQVAEAVVAVDNEQLPELLKLPLLSLVKLTMPVGVVGVPEVSVTLAVQIVGEPTVTVLGEQDILVLVDFTTGWVTLIVVDPWLLEWTLSPL